MHLHILCSLLLQPLPSSSALQPYPPLQSVNVLSIRPQQFAFGFQFADEMMGRCGLSLVTRGSELCDERIKEGGRGGVGEQSRRE